MKIKIFPIIFLVLFSSFAVLTVSAQDESAPNETAQQDAPKQVNLLSELNLSPSQVQQIRRIKRENQLTLKEAQNRLRETRSSLDELIYADDSDEAKVQAGIKSLHTAQAEVLRIRLTTEFAVRKILTPDQLVRFRELRRKTAVKNPISPNNPNLQKFRQPTAPIQNQKIIKRQRRLRNY